MKRATTQLVAKTFGRLRLNRLCIGFCLGLLGLAATAHGDDGYVVQCRYYYQDTAVMVNDSASFVTPNGFLGGYLPGTTVTLTCNPKAITTLQDAAGYYVSGWDLDIDWGVKLPGTFTPTHRRQYGAVNPLTITFSSSGVGSPGTFDLVPHLKMMHYTLAYDSNGGSGSAPAAADHYYSEKLKAASSGVFERKGYTHVGWNTAADGSGVDVDFDADITGATFPVTNHEQVVTLFAQWKANGYPLHLVPGDGIEKICYKLGNADAWTEVKSAQDIQVDYDVEWKAYAVAKAGYSYSATSETNPKTGKMGVEGASFEPAANAKTISVSFNGNGSTSGSMSSKTFTVDAADHLPANQFVRAYTVSFDTMGGESVSPREAKYQFVGWNSESDGTGVYSYSDQELVTNPCGSDGKPVMLYAQWSDDVASITLPSAARAGHSFAGWYADSNLATFVGSAGATYTPTKNETLYAKWDVRSFQVKFLDCGGNCIGDAQTVLYGQSATEPEVKPTRSYYKFDSWDTDGWKFVTEDLQVHPLLKGKEYRFVYNSNYGNGQEDESFPGGKCGVEKDEDHQMVKILKATAIGFQKTGYQFIGWNVDKDAKVADEQLTPGDEMYYSGLDKLAHGEEDVLVYAVWAPIAYRVKFDGNGETGGSMAEQEFRYDEEKPLSANAFVCDGQEFIGWKDSQGNSYADGQVVSNLSAVANAEITLAAQWSRYHYVAFDGMGATNEAPMAAQQFSGAETNALNANLYGKVGYTFAGWATNVVDAKALCVTYTNGEEVSFPQAGPNETNWLYAVWSTNRYAIAFDPGADGVLGTMDELTNCAYDAQVVISCGFTNLCSNGLLGWSRTPGAVIPEYKVDAESAATIGSQTLVSNLTAEVNGRVVLYAVWDGVGELSEAVGLKNAVLQSSDKTSDGAWQRSVGSAQSWDAGHDDRVQCKTTIAGDNGVWKLKMVVLGSGVLRFRWCYYHTDPITRFEVCDNETCVVDLAKRATQKKNWDEPIEVRLQGEGLHEITWMLDGTLSPNDIIAIDDVVWTPGVELKPGEEMPTYDSKDEAEAAALDAKVARPNAEVAAVVSAEAYGAMFKVSAVLVSEAGKWTLVAELKDEVNKEVCEAIDEATKELVSVVMNNRVSVSFVLKPGLYYGLAGASDFASLSTASPANWVLGQGQGPQELSIANPKGTSAFYSICVSPTPPLTP